MGVYYTFYYVGMVLLPALAGFVRDVAGSPATALFASAMMGIAVLGLAGFRATQRRFGAV